MRNNRSKGNIKGNWVRDTGVDSWNLDVEKIWLDEIGQIINNEQISLNYYKMRIKLPEISNRALPGQFANLLVKGTVQQPQTDPLLRRPLSFYDIDSSKKEASFIYRIHGKGTKILADKRVGDQLQISGPLGNGFSLVNKSSTLIIGGGTGIAPLYYLTKQLCKNSNNIDLIAGFSCSRDLELIKEFNNLPINMYISTEDGSKGYKGTVLDFLTNTKENSNLSLNISDYDMVYLCGPEIMMEKTIGLINKIDKEIACQLSIERKMACGIGACLGCTCEASNKINVPNWKTCTDGPVFWKEEVTLNGSSK